MTKKSAGNNKNWLLSAEKYFIYFIVAGMGGFIYEVLLDNLYYNHPWHNQGPLLGPWLTIYAIGGVAIIAALKNSSKKKLYLPKTKLNITPLLVALGIALIVCVVEYFGHLVLDVFFDFRPWDYSAKEFNLQGRIALEDSLRFVLLGLAAIYLIVPGCEKLFAKLGQRGLQILFTILFVAFAVDLICAFAGLWPIGDYYLPPTGG